ncbi:hypothetical protein G647_02535 [Cladophialophora carrionii CBS 160.54]|uniref:Uncharacterized protein n=1 Tax=Cladophialophora carrionii CBS 160.54 TaxID=1279043 RepID=V9DGE5_9EURO|nr:uncharacterized protein G647_02535 [Cladophialophora carrionii CBS 160.54]ETI25761.1 hypothetical protein G647_02535 [Cladophialophora carrionii CBS 160.54]
MAPSRAGWQAPSRDTCFNQRAGAHSQTVFAAPPLPARPVLFCCPVAENNPAHLPRSFVNPGRHVMNKQLRSFLDCADDAELTLPKCEVSHMIEVTTRALHTPPVIGRPIEQQWNLPAKHDDKPLNNYTPPLEGDSNMSVDGDDCSETEIPRSTWQSMSTRYFITQPSNDEWQLPPNSKAYREHHPEPRPTRAVQERYMEIPPFHNWPFTSESIPGGNSGPAGARPWMPACSIVMWCPKHNNFYEVHAMS